MDGSSACIDAYETAEDPNYHMVEVDCIENADGSYEVPSQDAFSHYVYVPKTAEDRIEAVMKYLNFLSIEENAIQVSYGIIGYGADLGPDGYPVSRSKTDRLASGTSGNPSDNNFLITNFDFEMDKKVDNWLASTPHAPRDVIEGKIASQYSNYFDKCLIGSALKTDEYVPLLQTLIVEFVFKCMNAPEGKFDEVYNTEYQILLDNHLQEVLDERAAWYDANH
jgi:putative aldouronate transport system substrate-binding protein